MNKCSNCKYFSKYRGLDYGKCENDDLFQFADSKEDLKNFATTTLLIMGNAIPVVGIDYKCFLFEPRGSKKELLTSDKENLYKSRSFKPVAANKKRNPNRFPDLSTGIPPIVLEDEEVPRLIGEDAENPIATHAASDTIYYKFTDPFSPPNAVGYRAATSVEEDNTERLYPTLTEEALKRVFDNLDSTTSYYGSASPYLKNLAKAKDKPDKK